MPLVDRINAVVRNTFQRKVVHDLAFRFASPFWDRLRRNAEIYKGGTFVRNSILVGKTQGGAYLKGQNFAPIVNQLLDETRFTLKNYYTQDLQFLEETEVENNPSSEASVFSNIEIAQKSMVMSLNEILAFDAYKHGQAIVTGVTDDRSPNMNGFPEIYNDGVTSSYDGNYFTTYGQNTRNSGIVGAKLNSVPYWGGDSSGNPGALTFNVMLNMYLDAVAGSYHPDLITGNKGIYKYIINRMQPQQRFGQEDKPKWGFSGFKFMQADFLLDEYAPSSEYGRTETTGSNLTSSFTSSASPATSSNLPAATTVTPAEVILFHTMPTFDLLMAASELFRFGWTGYKTSQVNTTVIGQMLFMGNIISYFGGVYGKQGYGFNS